MGRTQSRHPCGVLADSLLAERMVTSMPTNHDSPGIEDAATDSQRFKGAARSVGGSGRGAVRCGCGGSVSTSFSEEYVYHVPSQPIVVRSFSPARGEMGGLAEGPLPQPASALESFAPERASHGPGWTRHLRRRGAPLMRRAP